VQSALPGLGLNFPLEHVTQDELIKVFPALHMHETIVLAPTIPLVVLEFGHVVQLSCPDKLLYVFAGHIVQLR